MPICWSWTRSRWRTGASSHVDTLKVRLVPAGDPFELDGHALAKQGLAGRAMGIATSRWYWAR